MEESSTLKKRHRSPAFPALDLGASVRRAEQLLQNGGRRSMPIEAVAKVWEYKATSSGLLQGVSALKQYGLLTEEESKGGRSLRLSDLAMDVLHGIEGSPEVRTALKAAALGPKIFDELWKMHDVEVPTSDAQIRAFLIRQRDFNPLSVDSCIANFRSTIEFAKLEENRRPLCDGTFNYLGAEPKTKTGTTMRDLPITLPSLKVAIIRVPVPMSEADFNTLTASLNAFKAALLRGPEAIATRQSTPQGDTLDRA